MPALGAGALVLALLFASLPVQAAPSPLPPLGMDTSAVAALQASGAAPRYASFWVGEWMAQYGWGGLENALRTAKATGTTPVVYWWYWGDAISPSCVEQGCAGRTKAEWYALTDELAARIRNVMGGAETLVVLENEFNKAGISGAYAPTFDGYLVDIGAKLDAVPNVKLVLGFGAWNEDAWTQFSRSAAMSDYIGFQMMRGSTRHTEAEYRAAGAQVAYFTGFIAQKFQKPSFLYDLALSSYPDARWETIQAETLQGVFDNLVSAGQTGLQGIIYRSLNDHSMDPSNYFGAAESYWGLKRSDGSAKPAWGVWLKEATTSAAATDVPGSLEGEAMAATTGGRASDPAASGGLAWNLWANGELRATVNAPSAAAVRIAVVAKGDLLGGVPPRMEVRLGGSTLAAFDVAQGLARYETMATVPAGGSTLAIAFTNDARSATEDRNLIVDVVRIDLVPQNQPPVAAFAATGNGLDVAFDASASSDPEGEALAYAWSFGDGAAGAGRVATHTYAPGTYTAKLTVTDARGLSATAERVITATQPNREPVASFTTTGAWLDFAFDASSSSDPDGDALTYSWDFGDGAQASGRAASHSYAAGTYTVRLTVRDAELGATTTRVVTAVQPNRAPTASASATGGELAWTFDGQRSSDPDGDALAYSWSFGDGTTGTGARVMKTYASPGDYAVRLTVRDAGGLASTTSLVVRATLAPYAATFSNVRGNDWWVEVSVDANRAISGVCASVDSGTCRPLAKQPWGSYAASFYVPRGADIVFRATAATGGSATSIAYDWPSGAPALRATFSPYGGNEWWVQARIQANAPLRSVCALVDASSCQPLTYRDWGAWAASFRAPTGSKVTFIATGMDGQTVRSAPFTWPVK